MTTYIKSFSLATDTMTQQLNNKNASVAQYNQGDVNTDTLNLTVTHNNSVMDLTGATVSVVFSKPDGKIVYQDTTNGVTVTNATQGQLSISLNTQTRAAAGTVIGAVRVTYPNNQILETEKFSFNVEASLASDQAIASANSVSPIDATQLANYGVVPAIASLPTPSASNQFQTYAVKGVSGTSADAVYICKMLSNGTYDWVQIG